MFFPAQIMTCFGRTSSETSRRVIYNRLA
jgi:hypothetical protein